MRGGMQRKVNPANGMRIFELRAEERVERKEKNK